MVKILKKENIHTFEKGPIRRSLFSNGAVSLFHQFKNMQGAVVHLYFLAGSIFESETEHGLAHAIEHMLFKEMKNEGLLKELEHMGAQINGYTYKEYVCFEMECVSTKLELLLPKFLSLLFHVEYTENDLLTEKKVIIQEIKEDHDDHESQALDILFAKNFNREYGHPITGTIKDVKKYTVKDIERYKKKYFSSQRMVLSVASGQDCPDLEKILKKSFPHFMQKDKKPFRPNITTSMGHMNHFNSFLKKPMENCVVYYAIDGVSLNHNHFYSLVILDELLFDGLTSKLFRILREDLGIIYGLGSSINSFFNTGNYVMMFYTQYKDLKLLDRKIKAVLNECMTVPFSLDEIESIKLRILDSLELKFDLLVERCEFIAMEEIYGTREFSIQRIKKDMSIVSPESIMELLRKLMNNGMTKLILGPKNTTKGAI